MIIAGYTISDLNVYTGIGYTDLLSVMPKSTGVYELGFWADNQIPQSKDIANTAEVGLIRIRETDKNPIKDFVLIDLPCGLWVPAVDLSDKSVLLTMFGDGHLLLLCPTGRTSIRHLQDKTILIHVEDGVPHITSMPSVKQSDLSLVLKELEVREVPLQHFGPALPISGERQDNLAETARKPLAQKPSRKAAGKRRKAPTLG